MSGRHGGRIRAQHVTPADVALSRQTGMSPMCHALAREVEAWLKRNPPLPSDHQNCRCVLPPAVPPKEGDAPC